MNDRPSIETGKSESMVVSGSHTLPKFTLGLNNVGIRSLSIPSASIDINKSGNINGNGNGRIKGDISNSLTYPSSIPIVSVNNTGVPGSFVSSILNDDLQDNNDDERSGDDTDVYHNDHTDFNEYNDTNNDSSFSSQRTSNAKVLSKRLSRHFASKLRQDKSLQSTLAANDSGDHKKFIKPSSTDNGILNGFSNESETSQQHITENGIDTIGEPENQLELETVEMENDDEREQFEMETEDDILNNSKLDDNKDNLNNDNGNKNIEIDASLKDNEDKGETTPTIENTNDISTEIQGSDPVTNTVECGLDDGEEYEDIDDEYLEDRQLKQQQVNNFCTDNSNLESSVQVTDDDGEGEGTDIADEDDDEDEGTTSTDDEDEFNDQHGINEDESDDPLNVKELALSFDYLMYKIQDKVKTLSENIEVNLSFSKSNYEMEIFKLTENLENVKILIRECDSLNDEFSKLEQINLISRDFVSRLTKLDKRFKIQLKNLKK